MKLCTHVQLYMQVVGPADGYEYVIDYYGPGLTRIDSDNMTYVVPPSSTV